MINLDDVTTGVLVSAIGATGRWLGTAAAAARSGRGGAAEDLAVARWFETYKLTERVPPDASGLSPAAAGRLAELLRGDDVQAALQELLAVRLTGGPNADAARAREAFTLTLAAAGDPEISGYSGILADYYDDEISDLVGRLGDSPLLAQVRSEALSGRMIAVLHAIERHTAALAARPQARTESDFLARYRAHVVDQHGKLEPPDFERRRRVSIADIYVPTVIFEDLHLERSVASPIPPAPPALSVWDLAGRLDRSVLLGDPGGGKTTASTVLMHYLAADAGRRVPFLVTLRNFAAEDPPARSVVGFIENELSTFYQCPAPPGLVDLLLLTGRAVVIFDGLDELLDTSRRADVATRVERFCAEYPLAPVLVTSRVVGYDQARLDDRQFKSYRLGGFRDEDVADYARKWFSLEDGAPPDDADVFLTESESVPDLRTNPLLLSLMCILYRGEGSLPRNRAEVYEQCANLLFRRWDARRRIHQDLRAGHLVEPALRHLAWWLFTRPDTQSAVTERELVTAATEFLHGRGFESEVDAREAAREFVEFCRGRMWVFSDAGTTAAGDKLYAFTHRTFLEYFAAAQLAYDSDSPEKLARVLAPRVARGEWEIVSELSVQIKNSTSRDGAGRIYHELLNERRRRSPDGRSHILQFLARTLRSVDPSPPVIRQLCREVLDFLFSSDPDANVYGLPLAWLLASCEACLSVVNEEIDAYVAPMIASDSTETFLNGIRLAVSLPVILSRDGGDGGPSPSARTSTYWNVRGSENFRTYQQTIISAAAEHPEILPIALWKEIITTEEVLENWGLPPLLKVQSMNIFTIKWSPYLLAAVHAVAESEDESTTVRSARRALVATGMYLTRNPRPYWTSEPPAPWTIFEWRAPAGSAHNPTPIDPVAYLGAAAVFFISAELNTELPSKNLDGYPSHFGVFRDLYAYIERRHAPKSPLPLLDLPVPEEFKQLFRDWAEGKVDFIAPAAGSSETGSSDNSRH